MIFPSLALLLPSLLLNGGLSTDRFPRYPSELLASQKQQQSSPTYQKFFRGCSEYYSPSLCQEAEFIRTERNQNEPRNQYNFTDLGYEITSLPLLIRRDIKSYFNENLHLNQIEDLDHPSLASVRSHLSPQEKYQINHWEHKTHLLPISDSFISTVVLGYLQPFIEQWIHSPIALAHNPIWRVHRAGSVIAPHVDLAPNVITMIYQIDFDEEEEEMDEEEERWSFQLLDHLHEEHSRSLPRGHMLLYESHSVLFGRINPSPSSGCALLIAQFLPSYFDKLTLSVTQEASPQQPPQSQKIRKALPKFSSSLQMHPSPSPSTASLHRSHGTPISAPASSTASLPSNREPNPLHYAVAAKDHEEISSLLSNSCPEHTFSLLEGKDHNGW
jgi:hypothetical protein